MSDVKNILVVVDPTAEQQPGLEKAATLARRYGARLELFACDTRISHEVRMAKHIASRSGATLQCRSQAGARITRRRVFEVVESR